MRFSIFYTLAFTLLIWPQQKAQANNHVSINKWLVESRIGLNKKFKRGQITARERAQGFQMIATIYAKTINNPRPIKAHLGDSELRETGCSPRKPLLPREDGTFDVLACRKAMEEACPPIEQQKVSPLDAVGKLLGERLSQLETMRRKDLEREMRYVCGDAPRTLEAQVQPGDHNLISLDPEAGGSGYSGY